MSRRGVIFHLRLGAKGDLPKLDSMKYFVHSIVFAGLMTLRLGAAEADQPINTLTEKEKAAGWKLLFNGVDFTGWHNFKQEGVRPGWVVKDGCLVCVDPHNAGDIVTAEKYSWFELELDYNISEAGNSGIMYRVTDAGGKMWQTGPEFQLEDNAKAADPQRCGWLYGLYKPPLDPKTGKILDATKPVGEWNHVRLLLSPAKCEHDINGQKYFEYVLGSDDFKARVAQSKFAKMPGFAQAPAGWIGLQGDHGSISFRNIKIRVIDPRDGKEFVPAGKADASIDLGTAEGARLVAGQWRYSDTKIVEVDFKGPDKKPNRTYDYEPHAGAADFDDSKWRSSNRRAWGNRVPRARCVLTGTASISPFPGKSAIMRRRVRQSVSRRRSMTTPRSGWTEKYRTRSANPAGR